MRVARNKWEEPSKLKVYERKRNAKQWSTDDRKKWYTVRRVQKLIQTPTRTAWAQMAQYALVGLREVKDLVLAVQAGLSLAVTWEGVI